MTNLKEITLKEISEHENCKIVEIDINLSNGNKQTSDILIEDAHRAVQRNYGSRYISSRLKNPLITFDSNNSNIKAKLELIVKLENQISTHPQMQEIKENLISGIQVSAEASRLVEELTIKAVHLISNDAPGINFVPELFDKEIRKIYLERYIDPQVKNLKSEDNGNHYKSVSFDYILHLNPEIKIKD